MVPGPGSGRACFACFLEPASGPATRLPKPLFVNSRFWWQPGPCVPVDLLRRVADRDRFLQGHPLAWTEDPVFRILTPFWVPQSWAKALSVLRAGERAPEIDPEIAAALWSVGILTSPGGTGAGGKERLDSAVTQFAAKGYVSLLGVLHPAQVRALARYYCQLASAMTRLGDSQCAGRYAIHNERMARFLLTQFTWLVGQLAGEPVLPSYAYFAGYRGGARLRRHIDREQCEFSVTLLVNYEAAGDPATWPIYLEPKEGAVAIHQSPGDALFYRGTQLPHWREELPAGCASDSVLLHYVRKSFTGRLR
jgi:hypothetical protein